MATGSDSPPGLAGVTHTVTRRLTVTAVELEGDSDHYIR